MSFAEETNKTKQPKKHKTQKWTNQPTNQVPNQPDREHLVCVHHMLGVSGKNQYSKWWKGGKQVILERRRLKAETVMSLKRNSQATACHWTCGPLHSLWKQALIKLGLLVPATAAEQPLWGSWQDREHKAVPSLAYIPQPWLVEKMGVITGTDAEG